MLNYVVLFGSNEKEPGKSNIKSQRQQFKQILRFTVKVHNMLLFADKVRLSRQKIIVNIIHSQKV